VRTLSRRERCGSPAHAGIDPAGYPIGSPAYRLPRTRGDRPLPRGIGLPGERAPPHTRGSTLTATPPAMPGVGSPAHAGIDPLTEETESIITRLPRTRGDRPTDDVRSVLRDLAPPHTRGSTPPPHHQGDERIGSPAHAGIDPATLSSPSRRSRLPRTRGDRPKVTNGSPNVNTAPPHTRGSTLARRRVCAPRRGSPAHAGIDPAPSWSRTTRPWLPRTRGDRPRATQTAL